MSCQHGVLFALLVFHICCNHAKASNAARFSTESSGESGKSSITPELETTSDSKFFNKDYPSDERPKVDVLHFKHPYPVVQDSDDFDKDFVSDENSDNGEFKAQSEYDRLRHKLAKAKEQFAKVLTAKNEAEEELHEAIQRHEAPKKRRSPPRTPSQGRNGEAISGEARSERWEAITPPSRSSPGGIASPGDVQVATSDTRRAMAALEECKKQLEKARANLKKLLKELEDAKYKQDETQAAYEAELARKKDSESEHKKCNAIDNRHHQQYMDARENYLQQQTLVAEMEARLDAAASKVRDTRDGEDDDGGVYNTGDGKSHKHLKGDASSLAQPLLVVVLIALTVN